MTTLEILDKLIKSQSFIDIKKQYLKIGCDVNFTSYTNVELDGNTLCFNVQLKWTEIKSGEFGFDNASIFILIGHKTKSGYLSTKKLNLDILDCSNLTYDEIVTAIALQTDAIDSKFDPFYFENNIKRKNASAWAYIAANHLQDDCR